MTAQDTIVPRDIRTATLIVIKITKIYNPMTKAEYIELTGESPEKMFGGDWMAVIEDYNAMIRSAQKIIDNQKIINQYAE